MTDETACNSWKRADGNLESGEPATCVVFVLEKPAPYLVPTLDRLAAQGINLTALYHQLEDDSRGWGSVSINHRSEKVPDGLLRSCIFLIRVASRRKLRVLCCFGYNRPANIAAVLVARIRGVQIITRSDSNWLQETRRRTPRTAVKKVALKRIFGRRARVWTIGKQNDQYWHEMGLTNRQHIPFDPPTPPVGTARDRERLREELRLGRGPVFLYVGMLVEWKGLRTLLGAFNMVSLDIARLLIVGKGPMSNDVERAAQSDPRIVYAGPLPQQSLGAAYAAADFFVLPSLSEPWGVVVNEALANGLHVIASDAVGAAWDLIDPHANGWVFPAGDTNELAASLVRAADFYEAGYERLSPRMAADASAAMAIDLQRLGVQPLRAEHVRR